MTEPDWLTTESAEELLDEVQKAARDRLYTLRLRRLFGVACCTRFLDRCPVDSLLAGVEVTERYAEGQATVNELASVNSCAINEYECNRRAVYRAIVRLTDPYSYDPASVADAAAEAMGLVEAGIFGANVSSAFKYAESSRVRREEKRHHAALARDIFGNPFRPVEFDARWRTSDVVGLARAIYDDRAFERMPILADALMDAGCEHEEIIGNCRGDGPHVRGCWVVDLILDKK